MLVPVFAGLLIAAVVAGTLGYTYLAIARSTAASQSRTMSQHLLQAAAYTLAAEGADSDSDGFSEPPAGTVANADGWNVPSASSAPKSDAWGNAFKYCPWDNGRVASSTGRLSGDSAASVNSAALAVVSGGPDKITQTTCAQAKADTPAVGSDDVVHLLAVSQVIEGAGGIPFVGAPVASQAALEALPASVIRKGQIRVVGSLLYVNMTGAAGTVASGAWAPLAGATTNDFQYNVVERPAINVSNTFTSLTPLASVLNITETAVQYRVYDSTSLIRDSGALAPEAPFIFKGTPNMVDGVAYNYVGRRQVRHADANGGEVWSDWSAPVWETYVYNGYAERGYKKPSIIGPPPSSCPAGWVGVPAMQIPTTTFGGTMDVPAFCVTAYMMPSLFVYGNFITAAPGNAAFSKNIYYAGSGAAEGYCAYVVDANQVPVSGSKLIRESQWLAIAHNFVLGAWNWSDGSVGLPNGSNYLYQGIPLSGREASYVSPDPTHPRGKTIAVSSNGTLARGGIIYDIGGNFYEWTYLDSAWGGINGAMADAPTPGTRAPIPPAMLAAPFASQSRGMGAYAGEYQQLGSRLYIQRGGGSGNQQGLFEWGSVTSGDAPFRCTK